MPGAHIQKQDSLRLSCFCLILAHPSTTRSAEFTSGITRYLNQLWFWRCGEKTWAPDAANYKIDLASLLSFSSDLVREVYARGHIWVSRVSLYGLRKRFREEVFVFKCSWGERQLSKIFENNNLSISRSKQSVLNKVMNIWKSYMWTADRAFLKLLGNFLATSGISSNFLHSEQFL